MAKLRKLHGNRVWKHTVRAYPAVADVSSRRVLSGGLPGGWEAANPQFAPDNGPMATRKASGQVLAALAAHIWNLVGG